MSREWDIDQKLRKLVARQTSGEITAEEETEMYYLQAERTRRMRPAPLSHKKKRHLKKKLTRLRA